MQNGVVLGGTAQGETAGTEDRRVVGLGATPREHDLTGGDAEQFGDLIARFVDRPPRIASEPVRTARVGEPLGEERQHRLDRGRTHRRRRCMVEIGDGHVTTLPTEHRAGTRTTVRPDEGHAMRGYDDTSYGAAFADVYDDWYQGISDIDATIADLVELAGGGAVLELGVGTGRLAIPLAYHAQGPSTVAGIDTSPAMLDRLRANDPEHRIEVSCGDMVDDLPDGPFTLVFVAYNTIFNLRAGRPKQPVSRPSHVDWHPAAAS